MRHSWYSSSPVRSGLVWLLVMVMATAPSAVVAAQHPEATGATPAANETEPVDRSAPGADLRYITDQAVFAALLRPRQMITSPAFELMPIEILSAAGQQHLGIDPAGITEVLAIVEPPVTGPPGGGLVVRFEAPFQIGDLAETIRRHTTRETLDGRPYLRSPSPMLPSFFMPDETTLIVATDGTLRRMLAARTGRAAPQSLRQQLASLGTGNDLTAVVNLRAIRPLIMAQLQNVPDVPPQWQPFLELPELVDLVSLTSNVTSVKRSQLVAIAADQSAAEQIEKIIDDALKVWRQTLLAALAEQRQSDDPVKRAAAQYADRISRTLIAKYRPKRDGKQLVLLTSEGQDRTEMTTAATIGILVALLLPAVQAAREAARRTQSMNHMKQLLLGMLSYASDHERFPAGATYDANGKPLLSWRVEVLPYLGESPLYDAFHKDEPWDSPHNKKLIARMPIVFRGPNSKWTDKTCYLSPAGKGLLMDGKQGTRLAEISDGTSNTIALLEVNDDRAVVWTRPSDWRYDPDKPRAGLGKVRIGGFVAAMCDGSVQFISESLDIDVFKDMLTRGGGEVVDLR
jgi:type II secretory pathway pseudopilin PulG